MGIIKLNTANRATYPDQSPAGYARKFVYAVGTEQLQRLFEDSHLTNTRANPVVADENGYFPSTYAVEGAYRIVVKDAYDVVLQDVSSVDVLPAGDGGGATTVVQTGDATHDTLSELLTDSNLSYDTGENLRSVVAGGHLRTKKETGLYEVAAATATDYDLQSTGGVKFYVRADRYVTPDHFGAPGTGDETAFVQAALNSGYPVWLNRFYEVTSVEFPHRDGVMLHGAGPNKSGLVGIDPNADFLLATCNIANAAARGRHDVRNFAILGQARIALYCAAMITSTIHNVKMVSSRPVFPNSFYGAGDQYVFEHMDSCTYTQLEGSGTATAGATFKVNKTCLNSTFDLCYTNNVNDLYSLDIDNSRSTGLIGSVSSGFGILSFRNFTAQGARRYGIKVLSASGQINFDNVYMENSLSGFFISATEVAVRNTIFSIPSGPNSSNHAVWIDRTELITPRTIVFEGCTNINSKKIVVGDVRGVQFVSGKAALPDQTWHADVERASSTYCYQPFDGSRSMVSFSPVAGSESGGGARGTCIGLKCTGSGGYHTYFTVNQSGDISVETPYQFPITTDSPRTVVCGYFGSSNPTWASATPISPVNVRGIGGDGTALSFSHVGDLPPGLSINSSTGQISGTPTAPGNYYFKVQATDGTEVAISRGCNATIT